MIRVPKRKSGRLLIAVRDHIIKSVANNGYTITPKHKQAVEHLNRRIMGRLEREKTKHIQTMMSDFRTVIEFTENGKKITGKYVGTIDEAKANLFKSRGVRAINWAHFTKGNEMLISGMWVDMNVY